MATLAHCLPIVHVPKKLLISPVRFDVVDHVCRLKPAPLLTLYANGIRCKEDKPGLTPSCIIATSRCTPSFIFFYRLLDLLTPAPPPLITVHTECSGSSWHGFIMPKVAIMQG